MTLGNDRDEEAFSGEDLLCQHWAFLLLLLIQFVSQPERGHLALNTNKADNLTLEGYP